MLFFDIFAASSLMMIAPPYADADVFFRHDDTQLSLDAITLSSLRHFHYVIFAELRFRRQLRCRRFAMRLYFISCRQYAIIFRHDELLRCCITALRHADDTLRHLFLSLPLLLRHDIFWCWLFLHAAWWLRHYWCFRHYFLDTTRWDGFLEIFAATIFFAMPPLRL